MEEKAGQDKTNFKKRGGTMFPRYNLEKCEGYAKSLARTTHTGAQTFEVIARGVFDAGGGKGKIRLAACRKFGFAEGENKALLASKSGKSLEAATDIERNSLLQTAFLSPTVFRDMYTAFQGSTRSRAELKSQASSLNVHADNLDACVNCFIESGKHSQLIRVNGDKIEMLARGVASPALEREDGGVADVEETGEESPVPEVNGDLPTPEGESVIPAAPFQLPSGKPSANVAVTIAIDSTMDANKLATMIKLLKDNGLI